MLTFSLVILGLSFLCGLSAATLSTNLVAYYPFSGNALDVSGNNNHATVYSAKLAPDKFGTPNTAYEFNGSVYMSITNGDAFNFVDEFTISLWAKPKPTQPAYAIILDKSHGYWGWTVLQSAFSTNSFFFAHYYAPGSAYESLPVQFMTNTWNHYVATKKN